MTEAWKELEGQIVSGNLRLRTYLGGSGRSAVFLLEHEAGERPKTVIKLMAADPASAELQLARWKLAARLSHPHLLRLLQTGRCRLGNSDFIFAVLEYAEENLAQILPQRPLTPAEARDMLASVLDALDYIHGQGLVHGHVKPANIMAVNDQVRLSSDGLCPKSDSSGPGRRGPYDPPEAARGGISEAGDVWSVGVTLVEVLTQRLPVWKEKGMSEPVLPQTVPPPFREIAQRCLRRDPRSRATVADIVALLQPAAPVLVEKKVAEPAKQTVNWRVAALLAGLAVVAILVGPKLLNRHTEAEQPTSNVVEPVTPQPQTQKPKTTDHTSSPVKNVAQQASDHNKPPAASPRPEAEPATVSEYPGIISPVLPEVPRSARNTITGTIKVRVRVQVDPAGRVSEAGLDAAGPSRYFANLALQAARGWKFEPAQDSSREWLLRFGFSRTATKVTPVRVTSAASSRP